MKKVNNALLLVTLLALLALTFAGCAPSSYKLSTSASPDAGGTITPPSGTYEKGVTVDVTATPATGYRFDHWEGGASGASSTVRLTMDSNKNLKAYFTKTSALSTSCAPTGGGSISPSSGTYDEGEEVTLIATPAQYYQFNAWGGDASGSSDHVTVTMDSNKAVVASFTKLTYTLQAQIDATGGGTVDPTSGTFDGGTHVTVIATPESGYRFDHWGGSASGTSNPLNLLIDANKTVTAYFTKTYELSVSVDPLGAGTLSSGGGVYDVGTEVTLTATPAFPYAFDHWEGTDNNSANPTTVTMSSDKAVVAHFTLLSPGPEQTVAGQFYSNEAHIPIPVTAGQWVQGGIISRDYIIPVRLLTPSFALVEDFGFVWQVSFTFRAELTGTYYLSKGFYQHEADTDYELKYTIYS